MRLITDSVLCIISTSDSCIAVMYPISYYMRRLLAELLIKNISSMVQNVARFRCSHWLIYQTLWTILPF